MFDTDIERISYVDFTRADWLKLRHEIGGRNPDDDYVRFGGSDIGVVLGVNKYKAKGALFYELLGLKSDHIKTNPHMFRGIQTEDVIAENWYPYFDPEHSNIYTLIENWENERIIRTTKVIKETLINPDYPHIFANIDRAVPAQLHHGNRVLEIKNMMWSTIDKWEGEIDPGYVAQIRGYLMVTRWDEGELFILKDTTEPLCFVIGRNEKLEAEINNQVNEFADRVLEARKLIAQETDQEAIWNIVHQLEPEPETTPAYIQFLKEIHKPGNKEELVMDEELLNAVYTYSTIKAEGKVFEAELVKHEALIRSYFETNNAIKFTHPDSKQAISWKSKLYIPPKFHIKVDERNTD